MQLSVDRDEIFTVGLMSGTSTDGVDAALVSLKGDWPRPRVSLHHWLTAEFQPEVRQRLLAMYPPHLLGIEDLSRMNAELGEFYAEAVLRLLKEADVPPNRVLGIGSRGITIGHFPPSPSNPRGHRIEIAEPAIIAERTGISVVANWGARDNAAGGQGVLVSTPFVDWMLFQSDQRSYAIQNIGGIGNVGYVRAGSTLDDVMAFDTGPGNVFIDFAAAEATDGLQNYDKDGLLARRGRVFQPLVDELLAHPFFDVRPPRSTGRELFGLEMFNHIKTRANSLGLNKTDLVASMTAFTAQAIATSYRKFVYPLGPVDEVVMTGGGAYNPVLVEMVEEQLSPRKVSRHDDYGIPAAIREAVTFAIATARNFSGLPTSPTQVTGARRSVVLGNFTPGQFCWDSVPFTRARG